MHHKIALLFLTVLFHCTLKVTAQNYIIVDSLLPEWDTETNMEKKIDISVSIFNELFKGNYSKTLDFAKMEMAEAESSGSQKLKVYALNHLALIKSEVGDLDSAEYFSDKAIEITEKNNLEKEKYITYITKGIIYNNFSLLNKSSDFVFKTLNYFEETDNKKYLAKAYNLIGWSYLNQGIFDKAREFVSKALEIYKSIQDVEGLASSYNRMGSIYLYQDKIDKALPFFKKALTFCNETQFTNLVAVLRFNIAFANKIKENYAESIKNINKAIELDKKSNSERNLAYDYNLLGAIYIDTDSLLKAEQNIEKAYKCGKRINDVDLIYNALSNLMELSYKNKNYKKAFNHLQEIRNLDSLVREDKSKDIAQLEMQYRLDKQEQQNELEQQRQKYQTIIVIGSLILGLIILGLLFFVKSGKAKKNRLEKELLQEKLEQKNKELTTYVMYLVKKNELITTISKQLTKVKFKVISQETLQVINGIINEIQLNDKDDTWKEFEIRFQEVYSDFYNKLAKKHPDLTVNERRLSAFLKLNMTTKEISAITYQSTAAIEMARTRLRKKLGITNSDMNLVSFFATI
jgi:tetratricopeptide (TPR) repeat protein/DNA-binding CsgD family transcriptional regulator